MSRDPDYEQAVQDDAVSKVREFLRNGESPDDYVCFMAIRFNAIAVLRVLIEAGGNLNAVDHPKSGGGTPLIEAITENNMPAFRLLLKLGASINKPGFFETPLSAAAKEGSITFTKACLAAGAEIDPRDKSTGKTPLMTAAHFGHTDIVKLLLQAGANPRKRDPYGRTAREIAADMDQAEVVKLLKKMSLPKKKR
jgi:ankyrin repeat protein